MHRSTSAEKCSADVHKLPCSTFVEVNAPVFTREAWACVWHMIQNDLVHGWGLDWNFWRCVDVRTNSESSPVHFLHVQLLWITCPRAGA